VLIRYGVIVEGVQWLAEFVEDEIGDIDHIIDGADTDGGQSVFEPVGRGPHLYIFDTDTGVSGAGGGVADGNGNGGEAIADVESRDIGHPELPLVAVVNAEHGSEIAGHADMVGCIGSVGCQADFEADILLQIKIGGCG